MSVKSIQLLDYLQNKIKKMNFTVEIFTNKVYKYLC